jgi:hypothetical protein
MIPVWQEFDLFGLAPKPDKPERDPKTGLSGNYKSQIPNYKKKLRKKLSVNILY